MSESVPRELMILVERVVRPLPLTLARKRRMRGEFLSHLHAVFAEELAADDDRESALQRTRTRFGDTAQLSAELLQTISVYERWSAKYETAFAIRPHESRTHYSLRFVGWVTILLFVLANVLPAISFWIQGPHHFLLRWWVSILSSGFVIFWLMTFLIFGLQVGREWENPKRRWWAVAGWMCALAVSFPVARILLMGAAADEWFTRIPPATLLTFIVGSVALTTMGSVVGVLFERETQHCREWAELESDDR